MVDVMKLPSRHLRLPALLSLAAISSLLAASCGDLGDELPTAVPVGTESAESLQQVPPELQDFGPAIRAAERHTPALMGVPGVVGTGVGLNAAGRPSVKIFLVHDQVPGVPAQLEGVPVAREVTGMFTPRVDRTARARPAPVGFSVGHPDITAGTLGARVTDGTNVYILSNNHVIANSNNASIGDPILQPGAFDGGSQPGDVIGTLYDFQPISFSSNNTMDAAIAIVDPNDVSGSTPAGEAYGAPGTGIRTASVGLSVQKYGRTTGHTTGTVAETNVTVSVCFVTRGPFQCAQAATFVGQISISDGSFSAGGDSGSLIVEGGSSNPRSVGLLFAGSSTRTLANPIGAVLDRFGVTIDPTVPDGSEPPPPEEGTLAGTVTDAETGSGIVGAAVQLEGTGLSTTTGSDGSYTIGNVPVGSYQVTTSAGGYVSQTASASITDGATTTLNFALDPEDDDDPPPGDGEVTASVGYTLSGGPQSDRHVRVHVALRDGAGNAVANASVSAILTNTGTGATWSFSGTTGSDGVVTFQVNNAPSGCYETEVTNVAASGLEWDGVTEDDGVCK
jgi:hypothetical protein